MARMRYVYVVGTLIMLSGILLAACGNAGSAPTVTQMPQVAGVWTGEIMESGTHYPDVGLVYLHLSQDSSGRLSGSSKMCHGDFGIHVITPTASGTVTAAGGVTLDLLQSDSQAAAFYFRGNYSSASDKAGSIQLTGTAAEHSLTLTLNRADEHDFANGCPPPTITTPAG